MQTQSADNPDGKGPRSEINDKPTDHDTDLHNPKLKVVSNDGSDVEKIDIHGAAVNREDQSAVEAAEGEIRSTPQGP